MDRKTKRLGILAKSAVSKLAPNKETPSDLEDISSMCQAVVARVDASQEQEKIVHCEMTKMYMKELKSGMGPEAKLFYDYYALWVINKRVSELASRAGFDIKPII